MKSKRINSCLICGGALSRDTRTVTTSYKGHSQTYEQPGQYCNTCGEAFLQAADLNSTLAIRKDFNRSVDSLLTSKEIKEVRSQLGLSQRRAGEIFGGGLMAFSKYERGLASQSRSTDILLRLLAAGKINIEDLKS